MSQGVYLEESREDEVSVTEYVGSVQGREDRVQVDELKEDAQKVSLGVSDWLDQVGEDERGVGSGSSGSSGELGADLTITAASIASLQENARRVERISKQQLAARLRRARAVNGAPHRGGTVKMMHFSLSGVRTITELESADGIYDELNEGRRVVTQIAARTAIGKTTIFPARIAERCNMRVLLIEPTTQLAAAAAVAQQGKVSVRRAWQKRRVASLTTMTYHDFCGNFRSKSGPDMLNSFDVIIFDEAHLRRADVEAAKVIVASYPTQASLLVCSATLPGSEVQKTAATTVQVSYTTTSLVDLVRRGHLVNKVGTDRTLVLASSDEEVQMVADGISDSGRKSCILDSASRFADVQKIKDYLGTGADITDRYLVATADDYGFGHNFPVGNVVVSGKKLQHVMDAAANELCIKEVVCTRSEIEQQVARANRGLVRGGKALVCVPQESVSEVDEMSVTEELRYYVMLLAAHIRPSRELAERWRPLLPFGLNSQVAGDILAVNLPVEVAVRFFAADGRVPYAYVNALQAFSEDQHEFAVSEHDQPHGFDTWVTESMSGYYSDEEDGAPTIRVPCRSSRSDRVMIHAVCASALGMMSLENWRPQFSDSELSDCEELSPKKVTTSYRPRLVEAGRMYKPLPSVPRQLYQYDVPIEDQLGPRSRGGIAPNLWSEGVLQSLADCDTDVRRQEFGMDCPVHRRMDSGGVERVDIVILQNSSSKSKQGSPEVDLHSPGGSVVMSFRSSVWCKMAVGDALYADDAYSFFHSIRENVKGFVASDALSGWTDVWFSVFRTASEAENIVTVKRRNYTSRIVALLLAMVMRYTSAVKEIASKSQIRSTVFMTMLRSKRSYEQVLKEQSARGRAEVLQSERFIRRLFDIRTVMAEALDTCEEHGVFTPGVVTMMQNMLPMMQRTGVRYIDEAMTPQTMFRRLLRPG